MLCISKFEIKLFTLQTITYININKDKYTLFILFYLLHAYIIVQSSNLKDNQPKGTTKILNIFIFLFE